MSLQNLSFDDSIFTFPHEGERRTRKNHAPHVSRTHHNSLIPFPSRGQNEIFTTSALRGIEVNHFALPPPPPSIRDLRSVAIRSKRHPTEEDEGGRSIFEKRDT